MIKIDLRTKKKKKFESLLGSKFNFFNLVQYKESLVIVIGILLLLVSVAYYISLNIKSKSLNDKKEYLLEEKRKLVALERKIKSLKKEVENKRKYKNKLKIKKQILEELNNRKSNIKRVLMEIGSSIPEGIWIENISITNSSVILNGYTFDTNNIYMFFTSLKEKYPNLQLGTLGRTKFCKDKNLILCIDKKKNKKNSRFEYYTFSLNLKNIKSGENGDKGRN